MTVKLIWITPDAEKQIMYSVRVSSNNKESTDTKLLSYLINHKHWSPLEMANMCIEITTSRAISAQILRHRSFSFQEFSQRYAQTTDVITYEARRQDFKNRQNSIDDIDSVTKIMWKAKLQTSNNYAVESYQWALSQGIAKECARMILPMATQTKLYMNGSIRSWIHYLDLRCDPATQLEHREIALQIRDILIEQLPIIGKYLIYNEN